VSDELRQDVVFSGDYPSWEAALADSTGYDAPAILERVVAATRRVVAGTAKYERDGVTFDRIEYSLPLLAGLLWASSRAGNCLNLIDVGGSLGSSYRQNRGFLSHLDELRWSVVEQPGFVAAGRTEFETGELRFHVSLAECLAVEAPRVALLSGVLPYVPEPFALFGAVLAGPYDCVIVDRTPFWVADLDDRLTVERVPPTIYPASYPAWFFGPDRFRAAIERSPFEVVEQFESWESWVVDGDRAQSRCLLLARRPEPGSF
jgi:putative methyltransferase (TIGR04325 family)